MIDTLFNNSRKFLFGTFAVVGAELAAITWFPSLFEISSKTAEIALPSMLALTAILATPLIPIFLARKLHPYAKLCNWLTGDEEIRSISQAMNSIPAGERTLVVQQIESLRLPQKHVTWGNMVSLIEAIKNTPLEDRWDVIAHVKSLITQKWISGLTIDKLIEATAKVSKQERQSVINCVKPFITPKVHGSEISELIEAVARVPEESREFVMSYVKPLLITEIVGISKLIETIVKVSWKEKQSVINCAKSLIIKKKMNGSEISEIIEAVARVPKGSFLRPERQPVIDSVKSLINKKMNGSEISKLIKAVAQVFEKEIGVEAFAMNVKPLLITEIVDINKLIEAIAKVPWKERESVIDCVKSLINKKMNGSEISEIIEAVARIRKGSFLRPERRCVTECANDLINRNPQMRGDEISKIIITLGDIPFGQRKNRTQVILPDIVPGMPGYVIAQMIINSTPTFPVESLSIFDEEKNPTYPCEVLSSLYSLVETDGKFPDIEYKGSPVQDEGGVTPDFITRVLGAMCHSKQQKMPMTSLDGLSIPRAVKASPFTTSMATKVEALKGIGLLFYKALKSPIIRTGKYFHSLLFEIIHAFDEKTLSHRFHIHDELDQEISYPGWDDYPVPMERHIPLVRKICTRFYPHVFTPKLTDEDIGDFIQGKNNQNLQASLEGAYFPLEAPTQEAFRKDALFLAFDIIQAARVIGETMYRRSAAEKKDWSVIKRASPKELERDIQGFLTKQGVIEAFGVDLEFPLAKHLKKWLHEHDLKAIEEFLFALTGSKTLSANTHLKVTQNNANNHIIMHTCFRSMEIPAELTYEQFEKELQMTIESAYVYSGFQLA